MDVITGPFLMSMSLFDDLPHILIILISCVYDFFIEFQIYIVQFELYVYMVLYIVKNDIIFCE